MTAAPVAAVASVVAGPEEQDEQAVVVRCLDFTFPLSSVPTIQGLSLTLPRGSRCLLTGANGAGASRARRLALAMRWAAAVQASTAGLRTPDCMSTRPPVPIPAAGKTSLLQVRGVVPAAVGACARSGCWGLQAGSLCSCNRGPARPHPLGVYTISICLLPAAAGAGGQVHGGAGHSAHPGPPRLPRHPAGEAVGAAPYSTHQACSGCWALVGAGR